MVEVGDLIWTSFLSSESARDNGYATLGFVVSVDVSAVHYLVSHSNIPEFQSAGVVRQVRNFFKIPQNYYEPQSKSDTYEEWKGRLQELKSRDERVASLLEGKEGKRMANWILAEDHDATIDHDRWVVREATRDIKLNVQLQLVQLVRTWSGSYDAFRPFTDFNAFVSRHMHYTPFIAAYFLRIITESGRAKIEERTDVPTREDILRGGAVALVVPGDVVVAHYLFGRILYESAGSGSYVAAASLENVKAWLTMTRTTTREEEKEEALVDYVTDGGNDTVLEEEVYTKVMAAKYATEEKAGKEKDAPFRFFMKELALSSPFFNPDTLDADLTDQRKSQKALFLINAIALYSALKQLSRANYVLLHTCVQRLLVLNKDKDSATVYAVLLPAFTMSAGTTYEIYVQEAKTHHNDLKMELVPTMTLYCVLLANMLELAFKLGVSMVLLMDRDDQEIPEAEWFDYSLLPRLLMRSSRYTLIPLEKGVLKLAKATLKVKTLNEAIGDPLLELEPEASSSSSSSSLQRVDDEEEERIGVDRRASTVVRREVFEEEDLEEEDDGEDEVEQMTDSMVHRYFPLFDERRSAYETLVKLKRSGVAAQLLPPSRVFSAFRRRVERDMFAVQLNNALQYRMIVAAQFARSVGDMALFGDNAQTGQLEAFPMYRLRSANSALPLFSGTGRYDVVQKKTWKEFVAQSPLRTTEAPQFPYTVFVHGALSARVMKTFGSYSVNIRITGIAASSQQLRGFIFTPWFQRNLVDVKDFDDLELSFVSVKPTEIDGVPVAVSVALYRFAQLTRLIGPAQRFRVTTQKTVKQFLDKRIPTLAYFMRPSKLLGKRRTPKEALTAVSTFPQDDRLLSDATIEDIMSTVGSWIKENAGKMVRDKNWYKGHVSNFAITYNRADQVRLEYASRERIYLILAYDHDKQIEGKYVFSPSFYVLHRSALYHYEKNVWIARIVQRGEETALLASGLAIISYNYSKRQKAEELQQEDMSTTLKSVPQFSARMKRLEETPAVAAYELALYSSGGGPTPGNRLFQAYTLVDDSATNARYSPDTIGTLIDDYGLVNTVDGLLRNINMSHSSSESTSTQMGRATKALFVHRTATGLYFNVVLMVERALWAVLSTFSDGVVLDSPSLEVVDDIPKVLGLFTKNLFRLYTDRYSDTLRLLNDIHPHFFPTRQRLVRHGWLLYTSRVLLPGRVVRPIDGIRYVLSLHSRDEPAVAMARDITEKTRVVISKNGMSWWTRVSPAATWFAHHEHKPGVPPAGQVVFDVIKDN